MDCLFCKIIQGEIPCNKLYEDDKVLAFYDIDPKAPIHFLVIPKIHIASCNEVNRENDGMIGYMFSVIAHLAKELNLEKGYRIVNNCGEDGGQSVQHFHFHVMAGRSLAWPPG